MAIWLYLSWPAIGSQCYLSLRYSISFAQHHTQKHIEYLFHHFNRKSFSNNKEFLEHNVLGEQNGSTSRRLPSLEELIAAVTNLVYQSFPLTSPQTFFLHLVTNHYFSLQWEFTGSEMFTGADLWRCFLCIDEYSFWTWVTLARFPVNESIVFPCCREQEPSANDNSEFHKQGSFRQLSKCVILVNIGLKWVGQMNKAKKGKFQIKKSLNSFSTAPHNALTCTV